MRFDLLKDKLRRPSLKKEQVLQGEKAVISRPDSEDEVDPERRTQTALEQVNLNRNFRSIADFFESIRPFT